MKKPLEAEVMTGFGRKKVLEEIGCKFEKVDTRDSFDRPIAGVWACFFDGKEIARDRLQGKCVDHAVVELGGL